jgi:hypothetical protein
MITHLSPEGKRLIIPIIPYQTRRAWPNYPDAKSVSYLPLPIALTRPFTTDAHLAAYSVPQLPYRLSTSAVGHPDLPDGVAMVLAMFDIDGHTYGDIEDWWRAERPKVMTLRSRHPDTLAYRTRSGYRLVGIPPEPIILRTQEDVEAWRQRYLTWVAYLARVFAIDADPSCQDWPRLHRLPHATREVDDQPEDHEVIGDAPHVGVWDPEITAEDVTRAASLGKRASTRARRAWPAVTYSSTGEGLLYQAFSARGWVGDAIEPGKWAVRCPWSGEHTNGEDFDTSTVLWAPGSGEEVGWWYCSHAHCQGRDLKDVLALFTPSELDRAREAVGIPDRCHPRKGGLRTIAASRVLARGGIRTVDAKEVAAWRR